MKKSLPDKAYNQGDPLGPELLDTLDNLILELDRARSFFLEIQSYLLPKEKRTWARINLSIGTEIQRARELYEYYAARYTLFQIDGTQPDWFHEPEEIRRE